MPAIYLALERETALAEGAYLVSLQPQPIQRTRQIHEVGLKLGRVLDLRDKAVLQALGLSEADLRSTNHTSGPTLQQPPIPSRATVFSRARRQPRP